jgi:hypothetical protein
MMVIWQPQHKGFGASHWHTGTSVADDARRLDCAKSLPGIQIRIPGSDRVRSTVHGGSTAILKVLMHLSLIVPLFKN